MASAAAPTLSLAARMRDSAAQLSSVHTPRRRRAGPDPKRAELVIDARIYEAITQYNLEQFFASDVVIGRTAYESTLLAAYPAQKERVAFVSKVAEAQRDFTDPESADLLASLGLDHNDTPTAPADVNYKTACALFGLNALGRTLNLTGIPEPLSVQIRAAAWNYIGALHPVAATAFKAAQSIISKNGEYLAMAPVKHRITVRNVTMEKYFNDKSTKEVPETLIKELLGLLKLVIADRPSGAIRVPPKGMGNISHLAKNTLAKLIALMMYRRERALAKGGDTDLSYFVREMTVPYDQLALVLRGYKGGNTGTQKPRIPTAFQGDAAMARQKLGAQIRAEERVRKTRAAGTGFGKDARKAAEAVEDDGPADAGGASTAAVTTTTAAPDAPRETKTPSLIQGNMLNSFASAEMPAKDVADHLSKMAYVSVDDRPASLRTIQKTTTLYGNGVTYGKAGKCIVGVNGVVYAAASKEAGIIAVGGVQLT